MLDSLTRIRRWLILSHRYLGIGLGALIVVWFASGIGMMYAGGMPELTDEEKLLRGDPLDLSRVRIPAARAAETAGIGSRVGAVTLTAVDGRPAYRFSGPGRGDVRTVFADTGQPLSRVDSSQARSIGARFADARPESLRHDELLTRADQWTISLRGDLPLHRLTVEDPAGTELYVAAGSGEVVQSTTRGERILAWVAAIPHWLYFTSLRTRDGVWRQVILWTSGLGCVLVALGLVLGLVQLRNARSPDRGRPASRIPYRGWMRWHFLTGAVFGLFTLSWVFSGLLSMEPAGWAAGEALESDRLRDALSGEPVGLSAFPPVDGEALEDLLSGEAIREVQYARILGEPYFVVRSVPFSVRGDTGGGSPVPSSPGRSSGNGSDVTRTTLVRADPLAVRRRSFSERTLLDRVREAYPTVPVAGVELLDEYDAYHYDRDGNAALPVLRVKLADPSETWLYIDPATASPSRSVHRLDRIERWVYHGFHSLDFAFWYDRRPLWDIGVIVLLLGGLTTSGIGVCLGFRRLVRRLGR